MNYNYLSFEACQLIIDLLDSGKMVKVAIHSEKTSVIYVLISRVQRGKYYLTFHHLDGTEFTSFNLDPKNMYDWLLSQYKWRFLVEWKTEEQ